MPNAFVVAGTQSGVGKTTLTLGLLAAFTRRGLRVSSCKIGPDFIDPGHHANITGRASPNLDGWMLSPGMNRLVFTKQAMDSDLVVIEGAMGLFDGAGSACEGSTAQMAKWLSLPVLLVVNARGLAQSAAAIVQGFCGFDPGLHVKWVVFNGIGSANHLRILQDSLTCLPQVTCLGGVSKKEDISLPQRHLGLVTAGDASLNAQQIQSLAQLTEKSLNLDLLLRDIPTVSCGDLLSGTAVFGSRGRNGGVTIAVAKDNAFCFYYQENLELLQNAGAELVFFSPLKDERLPDNTCGIYIGGGYPELHAAELEGNAAIKTDIYNAFNAGMPIYAECGGFMYLCKAIESDGVAREMVGVYPFCTRMMHRFESLGYREVTLKADCLLGKAESRIRGHEFHYSRIEPEGVQKAVSECGMAQMYEVGNARMQYLGNEGFCIKNTLGSYIHLHFASNLKAAESFVQACKRFADRAGGWKGAVI